MDPLPPADQGYVVDDFSPYAIDFGSWHGHEIAIRWYGLAYVVGIAMGWWLLSRWVSRGRAPIRPDQVQDFVVSGGLGMLLGGRLGYCAFYAWDRLKENPFGHLHPFELPFVVQVWNGGMASHGGIIGLAVGCWWFTRSARVSYAVMADVICAVGPIGVICGRFANFINGELWGRPSQVPWAMIFPQSAREGYALVPRHPSQLYAAVLEGLLPLVIVLPIHARHRRPGLTMGLILMLYGIGRFIDEFFREPDLGEPGSPGVAWILGFMSKGQALTLPLMAIGAACIAWALSRPPRPELYLRPDAAPATAAPAHAAAAPPPPQA
jgi:phosphatidylglycerol:prolipoprotein diacylglycerol transferase